MAGAAAVQGIRAEDDAEDACAGAIGPTLAPVEQEWETLPFYDDASMKVYAGVEEALYKNLK
jgi:hypothetical protein